MLATDLGVARNTVAEVYTQLVAEGWLLARTGSGTVVAPPPATPPPFTASEPVLARPDGPAAFRYDLRPGVPDLSSFPRALWIAAARKALAAAPDLALGYGDPAGIPALRAALAGYLARARGVAVEPGGANIVICSGFTHGLAVVCHALRAVGAGTLAVEEFGYPEHRETAVMAGLRIQPIPVDANGAAVAAASGADAMLLTPAHQFPIGVTLSPGRRRTVAGWEGIVIEDDYDGEFRYDRQPAGAVQALAPDNVVYCGTASKSLAPGARIGWLVVPPRLLGTVTAALGPGPSALDQLTLAELISSGGYDRQVRRMRLAYRRRRDSLVASLEPLGLRVTGIAAGLHAVVELPSTEREVEAVARGREHGLELLGLGDFAFDASRSQSGLVVGYARPPQHAYTAALARLRAVLAPGS
jgi:GntR family transcriptional regulator/MocR family aminotransferase